MSIKFSEGYDKINSRLKKAGKFIRDCNNCTYLYKTEEDEEEVCQNSNVVEYDICKDGDRVYCGFWSPSKDMKEEEVIHYW